MIESQIAEETMQYFDELIYNRHLSTDEAIDALEELIEQANARRAELIAEIN